MKIKSNSFHGPAKHLHLFHAWWTKKVNHFWHNTDSEKMMQNGRVLFFLKNVKKSFKKNPVLMRLFVKMGLTPLTHTYQARYKEELWKWEVKWG